MGKRALYDESLAQARAVWGENQASAIWDAAIAKTILGGGSNARDLEDLSKLIGQRDERTISNSRGPHGRGTTSTTTTKVPILEPSALRTLPFGSAILLLKSAPPISLKLSPWTCRKDVKTLTADRDQVVQQVFDTVNLFVGQRRGAIRCVSGVCRNFPPFEGAKLELTSRF